MKKSSDPRGDIHRDGILKFINSSGLSRKVKEIVRYTRLSRPTVTEHLNKLAADNKVVKTGRGKYAPRSLSLQCGKPFTIRIISKSAFNRMCEYVQFLESSKRLQ
jgi:DeoR/GlpR family transcriptional regulator of sugar metabolism